MSTVSIEVAGQLEVGVSIREGGTLTAEFLVRGEPWGTRSTSDLSGELEDRIFDLLREPPEDWLRALDAVARGDPKWRWEDGLVVVAAGQLALLLEDALG